MSSRSSATSSGRGQVHAAGDRRPVEARTIGEEVAITVLDEGPGIPEESIDRLFELFYRDPASARMVAGSGIGLFVCASLAAAMGGRIWARRRPTGGSEFGFTMRTLRSDEDNVRIPGSVSSATG